MDELSRVYRELTFQNSEREKRAAELIIANTELVFQNQEKEKRAIELSIANAELEKAAAQFRLVVESAPYAMVLINCKGKIAFVNAHTEKLFCYCRNELLGRKLEILISGRSRKYFFTHRHALLQKLSKGPLSIKSDVFALRKSGMEVEVQLDLIPIETSEGSMVLATIIDISERKFQEDLLKKQNKELEQFAYIASHDLQEPLRTVSNYIQVFEEEYSDQLDDNARRYLRSIDNATKRMIMLVKSLLSFSRLGKNVNLVSVDIGLLIMDVIADLDKAVKTANAVIEVGKMPKLHVFESEIRQVFQNIISNALKFRHIGIPTMIRIWSEKANGKWQFSVQDNGIGIDPAYFGRVFEIFQRINTSPEFEGNGIGLSNCKKIILLHNGEIWIESIPGQGTTFHFTIPKLKI
jgi:PAS domain S-box-containing protein